MVDLEYRLRVPDLAEALRFRMGRLRHLAVGGGALGVVALAASGEGIPWMLGTWMLGWV